MLTQFFQDWNTAIQSRVIVNESRNTAGVITMQETKFKFRDVEIQMYSRIVPNTIELPPEKRKWTSEMFVPSTNKIIPAVSYNSKAKCAIAILAALVPGRMHEDLVEMRNQKRRKAYMERRTAERKARLAKTMFTEDEQKFIIDWLNTHVVPNHAAWNDDLLEVFFHYSHYITGRNLNEVGVDFNDENEGVLHVKRMYDTTCRLLSETFKGLTNGLLLISYNSVKRHFLFPRHNCPYGVYVVRSAFSKLHDMCSSSPKFVHLIQLLADYYAMVTGIAVADHIAEQKIIVEKQKERRYNRAVNGEQRPRKNNGGRGTSTYSTRMAPVGVTLGDAFGDVLDTIKTNPEQAEKKTFKKAKKTQKKTVVPVTDNQINGKQKELPKKELVNPTLADALDEALKNSTVTVPDPVTEEKADVSNAPAPVIAEATEAPTAE